MYCTKEDLERLTGKKNQEAPWYVNCAGYALGFEGWYIPGKSEKQILANYLHTAKRNQWRNLEKKYVKYILHDFPELKLIKKKAIDEVAVDLEKNEIIAFRIRRCALFCDFHFMKCENNGDWTAKTGHTDIETHRYEEIYDIWGPYDGKLYFFVRPRKKGG